MAETLTLGEPAMVTLDSTPGNLLQVTIPAGTRHLKGSSRNEWFVQLTGTDGGAGTAASQFRYDAGAMSDKFPGMGLESGTCLKEDLDVYIAGSAADQPLWLWAITETG